MRKFIVCLFALFAVGNATAETMCVKLDASKSCTYKVPESNQSEWTATCNGVPISGIAYCGKFIYGTKNNAKSDSIPLSSTAEENTDCWCRIVSPFLSSWVYNDNGSVVDCAGGCAGYCAYYMKTREAFRAALFSDLH